MCGTCGCDQAPAGEAVSVAGHGHEGHAHEGHAHEDHAHEGAGRRTVVLQRKVLAKNDSLAAANRSWLAERSILAVNLMSSPGAGKTTLLERTVRALSGAAAIGVVEGDQETALDAGRIEAAGAAAVQINTGTGCHLDAGAVGEALRSLDAPPGAIVFIENVGNLVCPALFDLGEGTRVVIASVAEGADKPRKYPAMFAAADLVLLNKIDLLPHVEFDVAGFAADVAAAAPGARLLPLSAARGDGLADWCGWIRARAARLPGTGVVTSWPGPPRGRALP